jgi:hypothetical protein
VKPINNKFQDPTRKDWILGIALLLIYLIIISVGAFLLIPEYWYWWLILMVVSTILLVIKVNRNYACRCRECGHEFEVSFLTNLISPHGVDKVGSWVWVKCPNCEKRLKAAVIKVIEDA